MKRPLPRLLQITHGHPSLTPGGTEAVALALHHHWRGRGEDCWYLGAAEPQHERGHPGTSMVALTPDQREAVLHTEGFDRFRLEQPDYFGMLREFANYLDVLRPRIIHFHHLLNFGLEALHVARAAAPDAPIVLTLHDYYLICASNGQLYRHKEKLRCSGPSLHACAACTGAAPEAVRMRELDVAAALTMVDHLIAPSPFLADMVRRALPKLPPLTVIENTYLGTAKPVKPAPPAADRPFVFAFFGNLSRIKGVGDLLEAAMILHERSEAAFELHLNGAQLYADPELEKLIGEAHAALGHCLRLRGLYTPDDLSARMAASDCCVFPSIWWENSPLVLFEAMHFGKPVVSYPHGAGADIVKRNNAGLLAADSTPQHLAEAMSRMMPGQGKAPARKSALPERQDFAAAHESVYAGLAVRKAART